MKDEKPKTCKMMTRIMYWEECGEPATFRHKVTGLHYCSNCAKDFSNPWKLEKIEVSEVKP